MRKLLIALSLALSLTGCAGAQKLEALFQAVTGEVVPPNAVIVAVNAFDAVEALGTVYIKRPVCATPLICRDPATTATVIKLIRTGRPDRNALKAAVRANPGRSLSLVDIYNTLGSTTSALAVALANK